MKLEVLAAGPHPVFEFVFFVEAFLIFLVYQRKVAQAFLLKQSSLCMSVREIRGLRMMVMGGKTHVTNERCNSPCGEGTTRETKQEQFVTRLEVVGEKGVGLENMSIDPGTKALCEDGRV